MKMNKENLSARTILVSSQKSVILHTYMTKKPLLNTYDVSEKRKQIYESVCWLKQIIYWLIKVSGTDKPMLMPDTPSLSVA